MSPDDAAHVLAAARARARALAEGDARALTDLLHEDFAWTTHTGLVLDRTAYVERNTGGAQEWHGQELRDPEVVVVGANAVLRCLVEDTVAGDAPDEAPRVLQMPMTQVWVRGADHRWRCLAGHAGPRLEDPDAPR